MSDTLPLDFLPEEPLIHSLKQSWDCPLDCLPDNLFLTGKDPDKAFVESIRTFGVLSPIWVQEMGAATYRVLAGRRRIKAARAVGLECIPALLVPNAYDYAALALIENRQRDTNPVSDLEAVKTLMERGHTEKDIGKALGINLSSVRRLLHLATLPATVYAAVKRGEMAIGVAEKFARLTEKQQDALLKSERVEDITERVVHNARTVELREATASLPDLDLPEPDVEVSLPASLAGRVAEKAQELGVTPRDWLIRLIDAALCEPPQRNRKARERAA